MKITSRMATAVKTSIGRVVDALVASRERDRGAERSEPVAHHQQFAFRRAPAQDGELARHPFVEHDERDEHGA